MDLPKILVSSTCYDLKDVRSSIKAHFDPIKYTIDLSEKNDIFYNPEEHTHVSCINAVSEYDILVLIIGGRYGGNAIPQAQELINLEKESKKNKNFLGNIKNGHVSITQIEVLKAFEKGIPVITFVRNDVLSSHGLYELNKDSLEIEKMRFSGIEKDNTAIYIFEFINFIRFRTSNNAYIGFNDSVDLIERLNNQLAMHFKSLLKEKRSRTKIDSEYIYSKIVNHIDKHRTEAFLNLFKDIDNKDEIRILGTGVTNFLNSEETVERYLKDENIIKILLVNNDIIKSDWACTSKDFLNRLNMAFDKKNSPQIFNELETKTSCPLASLNFLVDTKHFNKYYKREEYIDRVRESYGLIKKYQDRIEKINGKAS